MINKAFAALGGALAVFTIQQAAAQTTAPAQSRPPVAAAPRTLTHERMLKGAARQFERLDTNKDGFIDQAEYAAFVEAEIARLRLRLQARFTDNDTDKDGRLSRAEALAGRERWFQGIDANHDGVLDETEFRASRERGPTTQP